MTTVVGEPIDRVEAPAKVMGVAVYAAEFVLRDLAYAAVCVSEIPRGRIAAIDVTAAEQAPGVIAVITHENAARLPYHQRAKRPVVDPQDGERLHVLQGPEILFAGQPVAIVIAETQEQADQGAALIDINYAQEPAITALRAAQSHPPSEHNEEAGRGGEVTQGDPDAALAAAPVRVSITCSHAREHHAAMEPHATIAHWDGDCLTLYDKTQWVDNVRAELAHVFGIAEKQVRVISPFVGGAFGSALRAWPHVTLAALAARHVGRPVLLELTRRQTFSSIGFRPYTEQNVELGADRAGRLAGVIHTARAQTSMYEEYAEVTLAPTRSLYHCANIRTHYELVSLNTNTPCPMRGPGTATGLLALEMAMDELAEKVGLDPVELRIRNQSMRDQARDLPWSSNELAACYRTGSERFGWNRRRSQPRMIHDGNWLIGYGMATAYYPSHRSKARAQVSLFANGTALVRSAASDMGPGTYTAMTQLAADALQLPIEAVHFELGDTAMPEAPVHGGSITLASVGNAVVAACRAVQDKLKGLDPTGRIPLTEVLQRSGLECLDAEVSATPGVETETYASAAFGSVFAEVRVDPDFGITRVPRVVGVYDVGRVINPKVARSQIVGGMVGGIGMALLEHAEWDERLGKVMNANLAEYLVPVNADVEDLDVQFVPSEDRIFNPLGSKGLAEIAICGVAPAIANAVYNATGKRVRHLPILPEKLLH